MSISGKHTFALYCHPLSVGQKPFFDQTIEVADKELWHRVIHILRLTVGEEIILFDGTYEATIKLSAKTFAGKNKIIGLVLEAKISTPITPNIILMPSLLKREAFETVIYLAAQMGVTTIQPLIATKTHRAWNGDKERARLTSIMIAACEQAKNFVIPELKNPIHLHDLVKPPCGIYFEDDGILLADTAKQLIAGKPEAITLVFGPEGGLMATERQHLDMCGFMCCALTPTILRAQEAVAVGLGSIRSLLLRRK